VGKNSELLIQLFCQSKSSLDNVLPKKNPNGDLLKRRNLSDSGPTGFGNFVQSKLQLGLSLLNSILFSSKGLGSLTGQGSNLQSGSMLRQPAAHLPKSSVALQILPGPNKVNSS
jgi:hypothetical protein